MLTSRSLIAKANFRPDPNNETFYPKTNTGGLYYTEILKSVSLCCNNNNNCGLVRITVKIFIKVSVILLDTGVGVWKFDHSIKCVIVSGL